MGIIIKPLVTEKMTAITDKSNNRLGLNLRTAISFKYCYKNQ